MSPKAEPPDPYRALQAETRAHRLAHGCQAYTYEDGAGLTALAAKFRPSRILELGTALGYTACCLASGSPDARVDTIERDPVHVALALRHIAAANLSNRVTVHSGDFADVLASLRGPFDMVFVDGFAPTPQILKRLQTLITPGGIVVCANLGLASRSEAGRIHQLFSEGVVWQALPSLERGATSVWLRL